jgi:NNP family nitrate/nitrite transporter-like MFS transporter
MLPLFLVNEIGFDRQLANTIIGFSRIFGVVILFFSGMITDRIGHKHGAISFYAIMGTLTLLLGTIHGQVATPILIILQGTSLPCFFAAVFAMISAIFPSYLRSLTVSFLVTLGFLLGAGAVPPGIGYLAEALSFSFGFSLAGISVLATLPLLYYLRTDWKGDEQR